jgi:NADPH:quinone reductase-like Zn-dependent oxidoreductase
VPLVNVPEVPGYDVSGTVEAVGAQAQAQWKVGDQVWGDIAPRSGSYSQYVIADSTNIDHKPRNISFQEAAAIPLAGLTAFQALVRLGHLKAGQKVLVLGGSSGVGNYAIQIAKAIG